MIVTKNTIEIEFHYFINEKVSPDLIINFLIECHQSITRSGDPSIHWAVFEKIRDFIYQYNISRKGKKKIIEFSKLLQRISLLKEDLVIDILNSDSFFD